MWLEVIGHTSDGAKSPTIKHYPEPPLITGPQEDLKKEETNNTQWIYRVILKAVLVSGEETC